VKGKPHDPMRINKGLDHNTQFSSLSADLTAARFHKLRAVSFPDHTNINLAYHLRTKHGLDSRVHTHTHTHARPLQYIARKGKLSDFGGLVVSMLASGTQVRGSKPAEAVGFFGPMSQLCSILKKTYNYRGSRNCMAKFDRTFLVHSSTFR
jgi:hypothetical protein